MKILVIHNTYRYAGGEEKVVERESDMLKQAGHTIIRYERSNSEFDDLSIGNLIRFPFESVWSNRTVQDLTELIEREQPDLAHIHNTHLMITPSAHHACYALGVPVVQTYHNYRALCPSGTFFRDGHVCEDCLTHPMMISALQHRCFRGSRTRTGLVMGRELYHRYIETWNKQVDVGITPTHFTRDKLIEGGFDGKRLVVKPHFLPYDPQPRIPNEDEGYMLYIGRLSPEKGINLLLNTWRLIPHIPLKIIGEGPDQQKVEQFKREMPTAQISTYGMLPKDDIIHAIKKARAVIFPSTCYETFGMVIIEAYACGVAVIGSGHGAPKEIIADGVTGLTFSPITAEALAEKVKHLQEHPTYAHEMGHNARQAFLEHYTQDKNLHQLHTIYEEARKHHA